MLKLSISLIITLYISYFLSYYNAYMHLYTSTQEKKNFKTVVCKISVLLAVNS
jgi:hypothetical protein